MFKNFNLLEELIPNYYFHYSLNDYDKEGLEGKVPNVDSRIETFINLSERIGKEKVIWRFDPMMLTENIGVEELLRKAEYVGNQLAGYTDKMVISFADISIYPKVESNLRKEGVSYNEFTKELMEDIAASLQQLNKKWGFDIATCSEKVDLSKFGISHNKCIDDDLIIKMFSNDKALMDFLGVEIEQPTLFDAHHSVVKKKVIKDKGQREDCGCIMSKDIGQYNTCPHECVYCYANTSKESARSNFKIHNTNPGAESITGVT